MFSPGNGMGWILSSGARSSEGLVVTSTSRVRPLRAMYSPETSSCWPICSSVASSISMNSIGTRRMVTSEFVTMPAVIRLIASIGSSDGKYSMSTSMDGLAGDLQRGGAHAVDLHARASAGRSRGPGPCSWGWRCG